MLWRTTAGPGGRPSTSAHGRRCLADGYRFWRTAAGCGGRGLVLADGSGFGAGSPVLAEGDLSWRTAAGYGARSSVLANRCRRLVGQRSWRTITGFGVWLSVLANGCPLRRTVAGSGERLSDVVDGDRIWRTAMATASVPGRRSWQTAIGSGGGGSVLADCHERRRAAARPGGWPSIPAGSHPTPRAAPRPGGPSPVLAGGHRSRWAVTRRQPLVLVERYQAPRSVIRAGDLSPDPAVCPPPGEAPPVPVGVLGPAAWCGQRDHRDRTDRHRPGRR